MIALAAERSEDDSIPLSPQKVFSQFVKFH